MSNTQRYPGFEVVAAGRLVALAEWQAPGVDYKFELAVRPPGVRVIAFSKDKTQVWLTDEYRFESDSRDVRLPGGKIMDSLGTFADDIAAGVEVSNEVVLDAARREFSEEVGLLLSDAKVVSVSVCGATVLWDLHYVVGTASDGEPEQNLDATEDIKPMLVPVAQAAQLARTTMSEERSALALLRAIDALS